jgi:hypothetical protein
MTKSAVLGPALAAVLGIAAALATIRNPRAAAPAVALPARSADEEVGGIAPESEDGFRPQEPTPIIAAAPPRERLPLAVLSAGHRSAARIRARKLQEILGLDADQTRRVDDLFIECVQRSLAILCAPTMTVADFECLNALPDVLQRRIAELLTPAQRDKLGQTLEILDSLILDPDPGRYSLDIDLSDLPAETRVLANRHLRWFDASSDIVRTRRGIDLQTPQESEALMSRLRARLLERMTPLLPENKLTILRGLLE